jgi:hypothetical protein
MRLIVLALQIASEFLLPMIHYLRGRAATNRRRKGHNMNFWETFALNTAALFIRGAIKNPAKFAGAEHVIQAIRDDACAVCLALDPQIAPPPGYKAA